MYYWNKPVRTDEVRSRLEHQRAVHARGTPALLLRHTHAPLSLQAGIVEVGVGIPRMVRELIEGCFCVMDAGERAPGD